MAKEEKEVSEEPRLSHDETSSETGLDEFELDCRPEWRVVNLGGKAMYKVYSVVVSLQPLSRKRFVFSEPDLWLPPRI